MAAVVVVGAQWGDEGKAKVIDLLGAQADCIVRYQGGCNAGHTVVRGGETFKFQLIPSGILYSNIQCIIGPGTVIAPDVLAKELQMLETHHISSRNLRISQKAHITFAFHIAIDKAREAALGEEKKIGTTQRGIGPTYEDKVGRIGLCVSDLQLPDSILKNRLEQIAEQKNPVLEKIYHLAPVTVELLFEECLRYRQILAPFIADTDSLLANALGNKQIVLLEGAQGTMLDLDHGTYPFVTSSSPTAGGACTGSGIGPRMVSRVIGVAKAYTTRVGSGPFPTELFDEAGRHLAEVGREFGTVTGRARRCGWFDAVAMRYAAQINGMDGLAITKLDVFDGLEEVKICTAYRHRQTGEHITIFPGNIEILAQMEPVYETFPGWTDSLSAIRNYPDLPQSAKTFLKRLSQLVDVPVSLISVGPDREQTIMMEPIIASAVSPQDAIASAAGAYL